MNTNPLPFFSPPFVSQSFFVAPSPFVALEDMLSGRWVTAAGRFGMYLRETNYWTCLGKTGKQKQ
jgi:hypothetical protein